MLSRTHGKNVKVTCILPVSGMLYDTGSVKSSLSGNDVAHLSRTHGKSVKATEGWNGVHKGPQTIGMQRRK